MSVGDVKGYRRRLAVLAAKGHTPRRATVSVAESIARQKAQAARLSAQSISKKMRETR